MKPKRLLSFFAVLTLLISLLSAMPVHADIAANGTCGGEDDGSNLTWTMDNFGTLTISGTGKMADWALYSAPWYDFCLVIRKVIIENDVTSIGDFAFWGCSYLSNITIPDSLTSIGERAFYGCSMTSITIPDKVTFIGKEAFTSCSRLTDISVSANNQAYSSKDGNLFDKKQTKLIQYVAGKQDLSYAVPDGVTTIECHAFWGSRLTDVTVSDSVTSIEEFAFSNCIRLTDISVSANNPNYSSKDGNLFDKKQNTLIQYAMGKPNTSYTIPSSVTVIGDSAFENCNYLTDVSIPNGVTSIGELAFSSCYRLTGITIPDSVTFIGECAFSLCGNLTDISVSVNNQSYSSKDGTLFNKKQTTLIQYAIGKSDASYTIPNGVAVIGKFAFATNSRLTDITIPGSVTSIKDEAFEFCNLHDVYYGSSKLRWERIQIGSDNERLTDANIHFEEEDMPYVVLNITQSGNSVAVLLAKLDNIDGLLLTAAYDEIGGLLDLKTRAISAEEAAEQTIELPLNTKGAATLSAFVWEGENELRPISGKYTKNLLP